MKSIWDNFYGKVLGKRQKLDNSSTTNDQLILHRNKEFNNTLNNNLPNIDGEAMEVDGSLPPPPQEYSDFPPNAEDQHQEEFDYLMDLKRHAAGGNSTVACVDDQNVIDSSFDLNERFVSIIDQLDTRVEKFRKEAVSLQEKRDFLLMSLDLIKNNGKLSGMHQSQRDEIACYIKRVNERLSTVELHVRTVRDQSQEDSLCQVNMLIDSLITIGDPVLSRQKCQTFLNACSTNDIYHHSEYDESGGCPSPPKDIVLADKKFESALLGCTLDDQKHIKKRLNALMSYLNKQTVSG